MASTKARLLKHDFPVHGGNSRNSTSLALNNNRRNCGEGQSRLKEWAQMQAIATSIETTHLRVQSSLHNHTELPTSQKCPNLPFWGARQKGDSKWEKPVSAKICGFLRFPAKICSFLRFSAQICDSQISWFTERAENQRKSAKICENVCSGSGFSLLLSPFWRALITILFEIITFLIWKPLNRVAQILFLRRSCLFASSCYCVMLCPVMYDVCMHTCRLHCMRYGGVALACGAAEKQTEWWDVRCSRCDENH